MVRLNVCKMVGDLNEIVKRKPDLAILAVKYISIKNEDDIWLSYYFTRNQINYSGSSREILELILTMFLLNRIWREGIETAKFFTAILGQYKCDGELSIIFPLFLKPPDTVNGNGVDDLSFVTNFSDYESKIRINGF